MFELEDIAAAHVKVLFNKLHDEKLVYHNFSHTALVVEHAEEMVKYYKLSKQDRLIIMLAAWFHDTGHLFSKSLDHEKVSAEIMLDFLIANRCDNDLIRNAIDCIMATKMPANPVHLREQILCDADTYHLGTDEFPIMNERVKKELWLRDGIEFTDWQKHSLEFLKRHRFHTSYCQEKLTPGKMKNIRQLESKFS
jgi:predicted metal-dependent HD superfamily phosphohydrolase